MAGESTAAVVEIQDGRIYGASVGDSGAWIILNREINELTLSQVHKPLLGSGNSTPVSFSSEFSAGTLLLASDGLLKYGKRERIKEIMLESDLEIVCQNLISLVRLTSGALWDDVSFIICRKNVS